MSPQTSKSAKENWNRPAGLTDALAHGLKENEFSHIVKSLGREPSMLELGICSALYSEHCSYKSTKIHLKTLPSTGPAVVQGPGENAGAIDIGNGEAVVFKVESHNHPSFIEPFQGAATGVGGILRDVFTMGARPLALLNSLRFGEPENAKTPHLLSGVVHGIGSYGNCMGIPTVGGEVFFHPAYNGNCLVNAFALGVVKHDQIFRGKASGIGNPVFYVGSKTGRDGIHGASMASEEFDDASEEKRPTVQVGDPFQEKLLLEACLEVMRSGAVVGIQDMGAAGLTSSSFEMAERAGTGLKLHLDRVPQREEGMNPYEIMLSESQERMLLVVEKGNTKVVQNIFSHWELDAVEIGEVIEGECVELWWHGECASKFPIAVVASAVPQYNWPIAAPADLEERKSLSIRSIPEAKDLSAPWMNLLRSPNLCSRRPVYQQYDSTVRSNTVIHPGSDAAVIRVKSNEGYHLGSSLIDIQNSKPSNATPERGIAMTLDCNSRYCWIDPFEGTALSVAEAYRNISAVGATPIGISDCLNFGNPEKPEGMWEIAESIRGLKESALKFETPIVSGNVSLYNETKGKGVLPTPLIAMVGLISDASLCVGSHFINESDVILLIGQTLEDELGGSEYLASMGIERGKLPELHYDLEIRTANLIRKLISSKLLQSSHDLSAGGLALALSESCFGVKKQFGAFLQMENSPERKDSILFAESGSRYLVSCKASNEAEVREVVDSAGLAITLAGTVGGEKIEIDEIASLDLHEAYSAWANGLVPLFG